MTKPFCTLTGVDESISYSQLKEISEQYPFVEWGILYSPSQAGNGRYPSKQWMAPFLQDFNDDGQSVNIAMHLCGKGVYEFFHGNSELEQITAHFQRIQINFHYKKYGLELINNAYLKYPEKTLITQYHNGNIDLYKHLYQHPNFAVLFDASGGNGIVPSSYQTPLQVNEHNIPCGYAGGLGEDNIKIQLELIHQASNNNKYWIDMEGKLRTNDTFDLTKCSNILDNVETFLEEKSIQTIKPIKI